MSQQFSYYTTQQVDAAIQAAGSVQAEIKVMAGVLGIDWRRLIACIIRQVGIIKLVRCIIAVAGGSGDFWQCLGSVNWEGVIACAGEGIPTPTPPTPPNPPVPTPPPSSPHGGYNPNEQGRC